MRFALFSTLLFILFAANSASSAEDPPELHVVGVYEGNIRTGERIHGPEVRVNIDRRGESVILALGSHQPVRYFVTVNSATDLSEVYAYGYQTQSVEVFVNDAPASFRRLEDVPYAYKDMGEKFRTVVHRLTIEAGVDSLASFQGAHRATEGTFIIDAVSQAPELKPAYLAALVRPDLVPASLRHNLDAAQAEPPVRFSEKGFTLSENGEVREFPITLDVPDVSWPVTAAHDPEGGRLYGVSLGGEGFLYRYDMGTDAWSVAASMDDADATGLIHDPKGRRLIILLGGYTGPAMTEWTEAGGLGRLPVEMDAAHLPGFTDIYDPGNGPDAALTPLAIDGPLLLLSGTQPRHRALRDGGQPKTRTYLIDLETGKAALVAYEGD